MSGKEAHTVLADADGDPHEVWAHDGAVYLWIPAGGARLGPQEQEAMGQAYIAACNAADRQRAAACHEVGRREVVTHD